MVRILSTPRMIIVAFVMLAAALVLFSMSVGASPPQQDNGPVYQVAECAVVVSVGEAASTTGECILITCGVTDDAGPVAGIVCALSIPSQPGTDASLTPASVTTDEKGEGTAELCVGGTAGSITVLADADCGQGQVQVAVQRPTAVLPEEAAPTVVVAPVAAPPTGAGTGGGDSWSAPLIAIWSATALAAGAVLVWRIGSRRRRSS